VTVNMVSPPSTAGRSGKGRNTARSAPMRARLRASRRPIGASIGTRLTVAAFVVHATGATGDEGRLLRRHDARPGTWLARGAVTVTDAATPPFVGRTGILGDEWLTGTLRDRPAHRHGSRRMTGPSRGWPGAAAGSGTGR